MKNVIKIITNKTLNINKSDAYNIIYESSKEINIKIIIKNNINCQLNIFFSNNCNIINEIIILNDNSTVEKFKININNHVDKYNQSIYLNKNAKYYHNAVTYCENDLQEINQIELFHQGQKSLSHVKHNNIIIAGYVEVNCVGNVHKHASNSEVIQNLHSILISPKASTVNRPILNIDNKNIIAKHSCAVGQINESQIYYLQTKGFTKDQAKKIIFNSYFNLYLQNNNIPDIFKDTIKKIIK